MWDTRQTKADMRDNFSAAAYPFEPSLVSVTAMKKRKDTQSVSTSLNTLSTTRTTPKHHRRTHI